LSESRPALFPRHHAKWPLEPAGALGESDRPYRTGRSKDWVKIKNRKHPAYRRVQDQS